MIAYRLLLLLGLAGLLLIGFTALALAALAITPVFIGAALLRGRGRIAELAGAAAGLGCGLLLVLCASGLGTWP